MSAQDRLLIRPSVPTFYLLGGEENNLNSIFTKIIEKTKYYGYPFIWVKANVDVYSCVKPSGFTSGWIKGFLNLQNDNFDYDEIGTWWASGVNEAYVGFVYNINNIVSITWKLLAKSDIVIE